jgi:hypothetical protein
MDEISGPDLDPLAPYLNFQLPFQKIEAFILPEMGVHWRSSTRRHQALHNKTGTPAGLPCDKEAVAVAARTPKRFS